MRICLFLALAWLAAVPARAENVRVVRLMTPDDLGLSVAYYPVETNPAPAVLLLHSFGKSRDEWAGITPLLQRNGIAAAACDLRGHGESTRRLTDRGPELVDYHKFRPQDYQTMLLDINVVYDWLTAQPGIDKRRIAVVGSDMGANLALRYAIFNDELAAVVLLSPGIRYQSVRTDDAILRLGKRPLRIVVSREDGFSWESSKRLLELRKERAQMVDDNELIACTGYFHGVPMLTGVKGLTETVFGWLQQVLQAPSPQ